MRIMIRIQEPWIRILIRIAAKNLIDWSFGSAHRSRKLVHQSPFIT